MLYNSLREWLTEECTLIDNCREKCILIDNSIYRLIFYLDKKDEIYHYSSKEYPKKLVKLQSLVAKCFKGGKDSLVKLENFEYFSITHGKITTFGSKMVIFTVRNTKILKIC